MQFDSIRSLLNMFDRGLITEKCLSLALSHEIAGVPANSVLARRVAKASFMVPPSAVWALLPGGMVREVPVTSP